MVVRGARTSLARARAIRNARRSRSSKILSRSSSSSSKTSSSSSTKSTTETKQTKKIALYEDLQKAADDLQKTAKSLIELGNTTITAATTTTTTTDTTTTSATSEAASSTTTATAPQSNGKTEEELKKEIIAGVKDFVEQYNSIYDSLDEIGGTTNTVFMNQMKTLIGNCEDSLEKTGVSINKSGKLSITTKTLESADLSTLKEVYCKSSGITGKLMEKCESIESNASSTITVLNRMYGTQTYNKYGSSSSYYGSSGSWYSAIG